MKTVSKYWNLVRLDSSGKLKVTEISAVKQFLRQQFDRLIHKENIADSLLQKDLTAIKDSQDENNIFAERCLRCFISHQIKQACILLDIQFGRDHGFSRHDLFIYTLTDTLDNFRDVVTSQPSSNRKYKPLAVEIIETFNPDRASLSTWTNRYVRQHRELQLFLLEQGVYLISNWAILNDTNIEQVKRILSEFHNLTSTEIEQSTILLVSYHQIYRRDRLKNRQSRGQKCKTPTTEQLESIADLVKQQTNSVLSPEQTLTLLEKLAEQLREYRIYVRGGKMRQESLDSIPYQAASDVESDENPDRDEFLQSYQQEFQASLDIAVAKVIDTRLSKFKGKKAAKKTQFITALELFHCQGESMSAIAPKINLQAQYQVTRLLKLKELRTDIRHQMLQKMRDWTAKQEALPTLTDLAALQQRDKEIDLALGSQIDLVLDEAEKEVSIANSTQSTLAQKICRYLDSI